MSAYEGRNPDARNRRPIIDRDKHAESFMRNILSALAAPVFVAFSLLVVTAFPAPADLFATLAGQPGSVKPVDTGARPTVEDTLKRLSEKASPAAGAYVAQATTQDCFSSMAGADQAKLDRCARVVYMALSEVEKNMDEPTVRYALGSPDTEKLVSNLRLAAAEVCRRSWLKEPVALETNPACEASGVQLARK